MNNEIDYGTLCVDSDILAKAWDGDANSQLLLGKACFNAAYIEDNCWHAFKWIQLSAEQGNMEAQFRLADLFALGQGALKNYKDAYEWYTKAALQGYRKASIRIFNLYQQDRKMYSRGRLNSGENKWTDSKFKEENNIRELYEYRLKHYESKLNHAIDYYIELFNVLKSGNQEDPGTSLKLGFLFQYGYGVKKCIKLAMDYYTEAAERGNRDAQYHLGFLYEHDTDIKFNYRKAIHWYRTSATSGNTAAQNALGYFYEKGLATELNFEGAVYWYTKAANTGNSDAQLTLGKLYRKGERDNVNMSEAIKWYTLAANQGNGAAQNCLNQLYQNGNNQPSGINNNTGYVGEHQTKPTLRSKLQDDIEKMNSLPNITQLKKLAEHALRTDGNAMFTLGTKYYNGEDFTQDKEAGFQWIKKAAKTGLQKAEMKVAEMYDEGGDVVDQDYHESSIWIAKVVKQKNSVAQCNLGLLYLHGKGVRKDPLEASKWFTKSADQENAEAQYQFGLLRFEGLGLRQNIKEALNWFNKSARGVNINSIYMLGEFHKDGLLIGSDKVYVSKDIPRAIKLYNYAAKNGNLDSQIRLAEIYAKGELVDQNLQKAEKYYRLAANSFDDSYRYKLAQKYLDGAFGRPEYTKALELFRNIAAEKPSSHFNIFRTPIHDEAVFKNYRRMLDMFISAAKQGEEDLCYNIGYIYENGIYNDSNKMYLSPSCAHSGIWYSIAASNDDFRAVHRLGVMYEDGKGVDVDLDEAYDYYSEAYENGIDDAAYRLALMYMRGKGVAQDLAKAYCLFTEVSNKGHKEATKEILPSKDSDNLKMLEAVGNTGYVAVQYQLGVFYQDKNKSDQQAIKWLTLAAENGVTDAYYRLGVIHEALKGNDENRSEAIRYYSVAVEGDHEDAMYRLAQIYHLDGRVIHDFQKAYDLYSRAAGLRHIESSRILNFTKHSIGYSYTEKDEATVVNYSNGLMYTLLMIKYVAKKGVIHLQHQLGIFYISNKKYLNYNEAFKWFQMAASKEHTDAIYQLGLLYENGKGTRKNHNKAYLLYIQAKEKGHRDAIYRLGRAYHYGLGTTINTSEAIRCYTEAAKLGSNESQYKLGKLCISGELVGKDLLKALVWYTKAYLNGNCQVHRDLCQLYNDKPIELYFYERLFKILSTLEHSYQSDADKYDYSICQCYGPMYFKFGMLYFNGQGTPASLAQALKQSLKAYYDYGYGGAEPFISLEYHSSTLTSEIIYLAKLKAYMNIIKFIPSEHQYKLGMVYYNGIQDISLLSGIFSNLDLPTVLEPDNSEALRYFKMASQENHSKSQEQIGIMYLRGDGVPRNDAISLKLLTTASKQMSPEQCRRRGLDFYRGRKIEQNFEAAEVYSKTWTLMTDEYIQNSVFD